MAETKEKSLVVIQLSGGNDAMNTIVPYTNGIYHDSRSAIHLTESDVIDINGSLGFHPEMGEIKKLRTNVMAFSLLYLGKGRFMRCHI